MAEDVHRPLAVYRYRLTTVDALAYERLPGEWTARGKAAFVLPLLAVGALAGFIEDWSGIWRWGTVGGLLALCATAGLVIYNWRIHRRAKARAVREGQTEVEEWGDHLVIRSQAGLQHLSYEMIGKVLTTDAHVFILHHGGPVIVPLRAFEDRQAMRAFAEVVDTRSEEAVP